MQETFEEWMPRRAPRDEFTAFSSTIPPQRQTVVKAHKKARSKSGLFVTTGLLRSAEPC